MKKNKIMLVIGHLWQGGGERVCVNLANEFNKLGYEVELVVFSLEKAVFDKDLSKGVRLVCLNISSNRTAIWTLGRHLKLSKPGRVISFNYHVSFFLAFLKPFFSYRLISRSLNTLSEEFKSFTGLKEKLKKRFILFGLNKSDVVISQSLGMKSDLVRLGVEIKYIQIINNPINPVFIEKTKLQSKENYILFVGRLSEQKGLDYLFSSLRAIDEKMNLVLVGDGHLKNSLSVLTEEFGISSRVIFCGQTSNIKDYYLKAHCTVLSSLYEGFPNVLVESIACGTPVVSFDCPNGPSEIIIDGVNGYLAKYLDVDDFSEKVNSSLTTKYDYEKLKKSVQSFYPEKIAKQYIEVIFGKK